MWEYDAHRNTLTHSPLWKVLLGFDTNEIGNGLEEWKQLIHPDDLDRVLFDMAEHAAGRTLLYENLHRLRYKDGSYHWVLDRGCVTARDKTGKPLRILGIKMEASPKQRYQEQLDRLAENIPGMLYQFQMDADGSSRFPYASNGIKTIYELTPDDAYRDASEVLARIHPDDLHEGVISIQESARTLTLWDREYRVLLPERGERWLHGKSFPQRLDNGSTLWHGYIYDVTENKQHHLKLQETERLLRHLMDEMPWGICLIDERNEIYFRNKRLNHYFSAFGLPEFTLEHWFKAAYPDSGYQAQVRGSWASSVAYAKAHDGHIPRNDYFVMLPDGSQRIMAVSGFVFGDHTMMLFEDRTEQRARSELLHKMAYIDGLTGIANRRHFDETLDLEWRRCCRSGSPLSLLMIDVDHFKRYNDFYGHLKGDSCLQHVATVLRTGLSRAHDLAARYGGEEFACLLPECDLAGASAVAESLLQSIRRLGIHHQDSPVSDILTFSVGVASCIPDTNGQPADLIARADAHLYAAKAAGRNQMCNGLPKPA